MGLSRHACHILCDFFLSSWRRHIPHFFVNNNSQLWFFSWKRGARIAIAALLTPMLIVSWACTHAAKKPLTHCFPLYLWAWRESQAHLHLIYRGQIFPRPLEAPVVITVFPYQSKTVPIFFNFKNYFSRLVPGLLENSWP